MFEIRVAKHAQRYYDRLPADLAARLDRAFTRLCENPFAGDVKRLQGYEGSYRLRVGDLRILFTVNLEARVIEVAAILPRGQAYR
jgi:mRNA interferase RelE/StbE